MNLTGFSISVTSQDSLPYLSCCCHQTTTWFTIVRKQLHHFMVQLHHFMVQLHHFMDQLRHFLDQLHHFHAQKVYLTRFSICNFSGFPAIFILLSTWFTVIGKQSRHFLDQLHHFLNRLRQFQNTRRLVGTSGIKSRLFQNTWGLLRTTSYVTSWQQLRHFLDQLRHFLTAVTPLPRPVTPLSDSSYATSRRPPRNWFGRVGSPQSGCNLHQITLLLRTYRLPFFLVFILDDEKITRKVLFSSQ